MNASHPFGPSQKKTQHRYCPSDIPSTSFWPIEFFQFLIFPAESILLFFHFFWWSIFIYFSLYILLYQLNLSLFLHLHILLLISMCWCSFLLHLTHVDVISLIHLLWWQQSWKQRRKDASILTTLLSKPEQMVL